jgi:gluconolactonase
MKKTFFFLLFSLGVVFPQEFIKLAEDLQFPEGPAWDGKGSLYLSSCYGGYIYKISGDSQEKFIDSLSSLIKQTNGLTFGKDGNLYACDYGRGNILRISPSKRVEVISDGYEGKRYNRPNDLAFFSDGTLYFTDPKSYGADKPDGRLFRLNLTSGKAELVKDSLCFPNGIAFNEDYNELYVCESAKNRIVKFTVSEKGELGSLEEFALLPGGDPDGIAFDEEGNLYCAHFGGGAVYVFSKEGKQLEKIITPGKKPSNVEFGGEDFKTLYITEDETNSVYSIKREVKGLSLIR